MSTPTDHESPVDSTLDSVIAYLESRFGTGNDPIEPSTQLRESHILDSLGLMELIMFLEKDFGLSLERRDIEGDAFETPIGIAQLIDTKRG